MDTKIDQLVEKICTSFEKWLKDFEENPVRTTVKVVVILYLIRKAYDLFPRPSRRY